MAEPEKINQYLTYHFFLIRRLTGKKVFVSAGPTFEPIDPVRFIGNRSSGKMGIAIANELYKRGAEVSLVLGPSKIEMVSNGITLIRVNTAEEMSLACSNEFKNSDMGVMAAAVADYTPLKKEKEKIKKTGNNLSLELIRTDDILENLGKQKTARQV